MRIFLTGAGGFIGSNVARLLVREGHEVTGLVRVGSDRRRIADLDGLLTLLEGNLNDPGGIVGELAAAPPEMALHLAWYTEPGRYLNSLHNVDMLTASLALLRSLAAIGCRRFVLAGTAAEYAPSWDALTETSPIRIDTLYGTCKTVLCQAAAQLAREQDVSFASARIFNVYGPWEDPRRLVPYVIRTIARGEPAKLTTGEQVRDYLHVEDVASGLWAVARSGLEGVVNLGSGEAVTVAGLATEIADSLGRRDLLELGALPSRPEEAPVVRADPRKLREGSDWRPKYSLSSGLRQTIAWWLNNPEYA